MKFHEDGQGFSLESIEEVAEFQKLVALATKLKDAQRQRALRVFEAFVHGDEPVDIDDRSGRSSIEAFTWAASMDRIIRNDLDHRSIGYFVELVLTAHQRSSQAAKAHKRHAENHAMKAEVFSWLDSNMATFKSMDSAASAIAGKVAPIAFRTAREWVGEWKKLRSTGKP